MDLKYLQFNLIFQGINIKKKNLASDFSRTVSGSLVLVLVTRWLVAADIVKD